MKVVDLRKSRKANILISVLGVFLLVGLVVAIFILKIEPSADSTTLAIELQESVEVTLGETKTVTYSVSNRDATALFHSSDEEIFSYTVDTNSSEITIISVGVGSANFTMTASLNLKSVSKKMSVTVVDSNESSEDDDEPATEIETKTEFEKLIEGKTLDDDQSDFWIRFNNQKISTEITLSGLETQYLTVKISDFSAYLIDLDGNAEVVSYSTIAGGAKSITLDSTLADKTLLLLGTNSSGTEVYYLIKLQ